MHEFHYVIEFLIGSMTIQFFAIESRILHTAFYTLKKNPLYAPFLEELRFRTNNCFPWSDEVHQEFFGLGTSGCILPLCPTFHDCFVSKNLQDRWLEKTREHFSRTEQEILSNMAKELSQALLPEEHKNTKDEIESLENVLKNPH